MGVADGSWAALYVTWCIIARSSGVYVRMNDVPPALEKSSSWQTSKAERMQRKKLTIRFRHGAYSSASQTVQMEIHFGAAISRLRPGGQMKLKKAAVRFSFLVVLACMFGTFQSKPRTKMAPFLKAGPQAIPVDAAGPGYGLFNCQVGLSVGACYDPYQMRHAYNIDTLIGAGFDGRHKTIVIVDAFQSPNIVQQLNVFDTFYGLSSLNGLGGPHNSSLGRFTQIAPDGLTPFVPGDPNMAGWAEEISLDVLWAHAIAPGANITLVLAKTNNDADILSATKYAVDHDLGDVISQSFGENESCVDPDLLEQEHDVFADATMKNMTLFASSGDQGAAQPTCDGNSWVKAASSPASDPLVTGVGGTELHAAAYCLTSLGCDPSTNPAPGTYQGEIAWN
jgi:hypothetical protein